MTKLAEKIRVLRKQRGLNQTNAAKLCGINPSIWSRIEAGANPTMETVGKIAAGFEIELDELILLATGVSDIRIGFAHCIWAAPIIPLVMEGPTMRGIRLTSYGELQPAPSYNYTPYWYTSESHGPYRPGPRLGRPAEHEEWLPPGYTFWEGGVRHSTYTASDLEKLLKDRELDCVVAAKHVFDAHDALLLPCARIMDCAGGGSGLFVWRENSRFGKAFNNIDVDKHLLVAQITKILKQSGLRLPICFPPKTTAERTLTFFGEGRNLYDEVPITLRDWDEVIKTLDSQLNEHGAFLLSAWEPFISSANAVFSAQKPKLRICRKLHLSIEQPIPYISFDILFRRAERDSWITHGFVEEFLKRVETNIKRLKEATAKQDADAEIILQIASYLDMNRNACLASLSRFDFDLLYYPEWSRLRWQT